MARKSRASVPPAAQPPAVHQPQPPLPPRSPPPRRSGLARAAAAAIAVASATGVGAGLWSDQGTPPPAARILPDASITPGATDPSVTDAVALCGHDWKQGPGGQPPVKGGGDTYSQAARHTPSGLKNQVFVDYGLTNPNDGGKRWEIDHLIPLALGGRDVEKNLWPQSRDTTFEMNAWRKDKLESRLYNILCNHKAQDPPLTVQEAQTALRDDWTQAYQKYCSAGSSCDESETD